jgi:hypothetical protein
LYAIDQFKIVIGNLPIDSNKKKKDEERENLNIKKD